MKAEQQGMVCSAMLEFDYVRLSMRNSQSGEGAAIFLHKDSLGMVMRELRRVVRQMRQARAGNAQAQRMAGQQPTRAARGGARRRPAGENPAGGPA